MVSSPDKFLNKNKDMNDSTCRVVGEFRPEVIAKYQEYNWCTVAEKCGLTFVEAKIQNNLKKLDQNALAYEALGKTRMMMDYNFRILCLNKGAVNEMDEIQMWNEFAQDGEGVRLGLFLNLIQPGLLHVKYTDEVPILDLSKIDSLPITADIVLDILATKKLHFKGENEVRLIRQRSKWYDDNSSGVRISYWKFPPELISRIDVGWNFKGDTTHFVKRYSAIYPWADFYKCIKPSKSKIEYSLLRAGNDSAYRKDILLD